MIPMRSPNPTKHHRPKDFCTIEQAEYIAVRATRQLIEQYHAQYHPLPWWRRWLLAARRAL